MIFSDFAGSTCEICACKREEIPVSETLPEIYSKIDVPISESIPEIPISKFLYLIPEDDEEIPSTPISEPVTPLLEINSTTQHASTSKSKAPSSQVPERDPM